MYSGTSMGNRKVIIFILTLIVIVNNISGIIAVCEQSPTGEIRHMNYTACAPTGKVFGHCAIKLPEWRKNREATEFRIEFNVDGDKPTYGNTYTLFRSVGPWGPDMKLTQIEGCSNVRINETCVAPKTDSGETLAVGMAMYGYFFYCVSAIEETENRLYPCSEPKTTGCYYLINGVIKIHVEYNPTSFQKERLKRKRQYCVFEPKVGDIYVEDDSLISLNPNQERLFGTKTEYEEKFGACTLVNVTENTGNNLILLARNHTNIPHDKFACMYWKEGKEWYDNIWCTRIQRSNRDSKIWIYPCAAAIAFALIALMICLYKTRAYKYTFRKGLPQIPEPLVIASSETKSDHEAMQQEHKIPREKIYSFADFAPSVTENEFPKKKKKEDEKNWNDREDSTDDEAAERSFEATSYIRVKGDPDT